MLLKVVPVGVPTWVKCGAAGAGAALDAVAGDADVVGGGGPAEVDLGGAGRRGGQPGGVDGGVVSGAAGVVAVAIVE